MSGNVQRVPRVVRMWRRVSESIIVGIGIRERLIPFVRRESRGLSPGAGRGTRGAGGGRGARDMLPCAPGEARGGDSLLAAPARRARLARLC